MKNKYGESFDEFVANSIPGVNDMKTPPSYAAHVGSSSTHADGMFNADGTFK